MEEMQANVIKVDDIFVHIGTKNTSFLSIANDLRQKGIKNWGFMLEIKDPTIINIDPFAEDGDGHTTLTKDQIHRVTMECLNNPWYYLREIVRIPVEAGVEGEVGNWKWYTATKPDIVRTYCFLNHIDTVSEIKPFTKLNILALMSWMLMFKGLLTNAAIYEYRTSADPSGIGIIRSILSNLPGYLTAGKYICSNADSENISNELMHCKIKANVFPRTCEGTYDIARGATYPVIFVDNITRSLYPMEVLATTYPAYVAGCEMSKDNGSSYGRIITYDADISNHPELSRIFVDCIDIWEDGWFDINPCSKLLDTLNEYHLLNVGY